MQTFRTISLLSALLLALGLTSGCDTASWRGDGNSEDTASEEDGDDNDDDDCEGDDDDGDDG